MFDTVMNRVRVLVVVSFCWGALASLDQFVRADEPKLVGHWKLTGNARDSSGSDRHGQAREVNFDATGPSGRAGGAAAFDGKASLVVVPAARAPALGARPFSIALWAHTEQDLDDVLGDLVSQFDLETGKGFHFSIQDFAGVVSAQSNYRQLHFGVDASRLAPQWTDCGRPGNNLFVFALCVFDGQLFAGTFEHGKEESGHVYRYAGGEQWIDCGSPDRCNAIESLAVYNGRLYAGASRYLSAGSALPESLNEHPGGKVFRYERDGEWTDCGKLQNAETGESFTVGGMAVFRGQLYAGASKPAGRGLYRYDGGQQWKYLGHPGNRVTNPVVYNGSMYFCSLDGGGISRYGRDATWTDVGKPDKVSQTYGFAIYRGELYASSWPNGEVFQYDGQRSWLNRGRLGNELEVMGMVVYNGRLYAGTLPLAQVYRYAGGTTWENTGQLDTTPDVRYRRAWSMAVYQGRLYCGTLPSGHVFSLEAGQNVTYDRELPAGWVHLAAVRDADHLRLYVNGQLVAKSGTFAGSDYDLTNTAPLHLGFGAHDHFNGKLRDVRIYQGALTDSEVATLAEER